MNRKFRRKPNRPNRKDEKGQASLMVAMMMMTFLFFFCFVINVGMLVNAKIQLQNAADLAAYAGAAVQARQLNTISYLNYEMRRQYKKFLFRYYVFGNMAQKQFPTGDTGNKPATPYDWSPDASAGNAAVHFKVPAVCLIFNSNDNYCQVNNLPKIDIPKASSFDLINDALRNSLTNLEKLRQDNCGKIALTNMYTLALWLYSGDPDANPDFGLGADPKLKNVQTVVEGLVKGLGLVPREILLRLRIETLKKYLNDPAKSVTASSVEGLLGSGDPHHYERSIQAFKSAFYTLGDHTFSSDGIVMEELQSPAQIELTENKVRFDTWAIYFDLKDTTGKTADTIGDNCDPHLVPQSMKSDVAVGVAKDPKLLTYYAVRLRAKAKLLFNPWGSDGIELKAYAAAQPFGSRIGPDLKPDAWVRVAQPDPTRVSQLINVTNKDSIIGQVPNLPITEDDSLNMGWNTTEVLGALMARAFPSSGTGPKQISPADLARAYQLAMAPNPYETKFYNIPNDLYQNNPQSFLPSVFDKTGAAIYWAPLAPPDSPGDLDGELRSTIDDLFQGVDPSSAQLKDTLKTQLSKYVGGLKGVTNLNDCGTAKLAANLDDSDCESFNMVRITNPLRPRPMAANNGSGASLLQLPPWFMPQTDKEVLTSWNSPNDPPAKDVGRMGYSVKFISFDSLVNGKVGTDSKNQTPPQNPPGADDSEAKVDMPLIQH